MVRSCATLSKAFGTGGGLVYGAKGWVEALEKDSRIFAGASSIPIVVAAAAAKALQIAREDPDLRRKLWQNVAQAKQGIADLGFSVGSSPVPIVCIPSQPGLNLVRLRDELFSAQIAVEWVQQYTSAPAGGALRIAIFATHTAEQIKRLIDELKRLV
ncbi:aminotransferase class I/II-fold pyridoxal phosphate-dependent enzyme [bacterium]|nr:aminotransferase class I/II-fold pyridoxal phosphate-dependent enzyme [bacterium]